MQKKFLKNLSKTEAESSRQHNKDVVALDAMGGDLAPHATVRGALKAAREMIPVLLCGDEDTLIPLLDSVDTNWRRLPVTVEHCTQVITMHDIPGRAILKKRDSSLVRALQALLEGRAGAFVSAGNSGAVLVAATLILGRVDNVMRPVLAEFFPLPSGKSIFCLDLGANTDPHPETLQQFAHIGSSYVRFSTGVTSPRIGLISNGEESCKGNQLIKKTYELLSKSPTLNFVGNVEPGDLFEGNLDVVVTDGFTGNIMLKTIQGSLKSVAAWLKMLAKQTISNRLALLCSSHLFRQLKNEMNALTASGALLLGVNGTCVVSHGCSTESSIFSAVSKAFFLSKTNKIRAFNKILTSEISTTYSPKNNEQVISR